MQLTSAACADLTQTPPFTEWPAPILVIEELSKVKSKATCSSESVQHGTSVTDGSVQNIQTLDLDSVQDASKKTATQLCNRL